MMIIKKELRNENANIYLIFSVVLPSLRDESQNRRMNESRNPKIWTCKIVIKTTHSLIVVVVAFVVIVMYKQKKYKNMEVQFLRRWSTTRARARAQSGVFRNYFGRKVSHDSAKNVFTDVTMTCLRPKSDLNDSTNCIKCITCRCPSKGQAIDMIMLNKMITIPKKNFIRRHPHRTCRHCNLYVLPHHIPQHSNYVKI